MGVAKCPAFQIEMFMGNYFVWKCQVKVLVAEADHLNFKEPYKGTDVGFKYTWDMVEFTSINPKLRNHFHF